MINGVNLNKQTIMTTTFIKEALLTAKYYHNLFKGYELYVILSETGLVFKIHSDNIDSNFESIIQEENKKLLVEGDYYNYFVVLPSNFETYNGGSEEVNLRDIDEINLNI